MRNPTGSDLRQHIVMFYKQMLKRNQPKTTCVKFIT